MKEKWREKLRRNCVESNHWVKENANRVDQLESRNDGSIRADCSAEKKRELDVSPCSEKR